MYEYIYKHVNKDNSGNSVTTNEMRYDHIVPELSSVTLLALFIFFSVVSIIYQKRGKKRLSQ